MVPLFARDQQVELRLKRRDIDAQLIYETAHELAFRIEAQELDKEMTGFAPIEQLREFLGPNNVRVNYRQGNYRCVFESALKRLDVDRSCPRGSLILNLQLPPRVRRILDPVGRAQNPS